MRQAVVAVAILMSPLAFAQKDTTPFNCEQVDARAMRTIHPAAFGQLCRNLEANHMRSMAKLTGQPRPSKTVVNLPEYGTQLAIDTGLACMSGQAMRRLANGWEQILDETGNWQRCEPME